MYAIRSYYEIYNEIQGMFGFVPNAIRLDSINPSHMARHWEGIKDSLGHETLSAKLFTLIRLLVSEATHCEYCVGLNAGILMQMHGMDQAAIARVITSYSIHYTKLYDIPASDGSRRE